MFPQILTCLSYLLKEKTSTMEEFPTVKGTLHTLSPFDLPTTLGGRHYMEYAIAQIVDYPSFINLKIQKKHLFSIKKTLLTPFYMYRN